MPRIILLVISIEKPGTEQPAGQASRWTLRWGLLGSCPGPLAEPGGEFSGTTLAAPADFNLSDHSFIWHLAMQILQADA